MRNMTIRAFAIAGMLGASTLGAATGEKQAIEPKQLLEKARGAGLKPIPPVSYTHLTLPTKVWRCRSRWSPYH